MQNVLAKENASGAHCVEPMYGGGVHLKAAAAAAGKTGRQHTAARPGVNPGGKPGTGTGVVLTVPCSTPCARAHPNKQQAPSFLTMGLST
eukprot:1154012-Pelagomonas_calceolata.AAC.2